MHNSVRYAFAIISILIYGYLDAQVADTADKSIWTIQDCINYAVEHNIQVNTLRFNEQAARQNLAAAKGARIPSLSAVIGGTVSNANNQGTSSGEMVNQSTGGSSYIVNSSLTLWNGNYINNNIRQQNLISESAGLSVQQSQNNITLLITEAYLGILLAKENEKYVIDLVKTTESGVKQGQLLYDAGSIAKKDLLQLQAQLAGNRYLLVQTQNAIRQSILTLKQILQLPTEASFDIVVPGEITIAGSLPLLHDVQQTALGNFPDMKIGKLGVEIADLGIAKAKAGFKPTLTANGVIGTGYYNVFTHNVVPNKSYFQQAGNKLYETFGVSLYVPVFSQRINKTNLEKAKIAYRQADLELQNNQLVLSQAVEQAFLSAVNARQSYVAANQQLLAATESYRIANEELKLGAINTYDLLLQQNQYLQAVQAFTQAKYNAVLQQKIYEFYMGSPVTL